MNIALVILHADPSRGGAERYTVDLAQALGKRGHAVTLVASTCSQPEFGAATCVTLEESGLTRASRYKTFLDRLDEHLTQHSYDVVHAMLPVRQCDFYHPHAGIAAEAAVWWNSVFNPRRAMMARVEKRLLTGANPPTVLVLSDYVKTFVRRHFPVEVLPDDRLKRLFNAVDIHRFSLDGSAAIEGARSSSSPEGFTGLIIAQDFRRKGVRQAIRALAQMGNPSLKLVVVGKDDPAPFVKEAASLDIASQIEFVGPVTDPRPYYRSADFFVLPTHHDPCSLVVLESLAMGLPVISTKFNGACEIMVEGVHGFVLEDPDDIDALATAMKQLIDPVRRAQMRAACMTLRPELSFEHHLDFLEGMYRGVQRGA